jgi:hypothetical protein
MSRPAAAHTLWTRLHQAWLARHPVRLADPRLAEDAGMLAAPALAYLSPLVGAWLR